jgi:hypothetical protein
MKKITNFIIAIIIVLFAATLTNGQITISLPSLKVHVGDTIQVPINVTSFNNIGAFGFIIRWDTT